MKQDLIARTIAFIIVFIILICFNTLYSKNYFLKPSEVYKTISLEIKNFESVKENINKNNNIEKNTNNIKQDLDITKTKNPPIKESIDKKDNKKIVKKIAKQVISKTKNKVKTNNKKNIVKTNSKSNSIVTANNKNYKEISQNNINIKNIENELTNLLFKNQVYPRKARRNHLEGTVLVEFTIENGNIIKCAINKKSEYSVLDNAALKLCMNIKEQQFNNKIKDKIKFIVPIKYQLSN